MASAPSHPLIPSTRTHRPQQHPRPPRPATLPLQEAQHTWPRSSLQPAHSPPAPRPAPRDPRHPPCRLPGPSRRRSARPGYAVGCYVRPEVSERALLAAVFGVLVAGRGCARAAMRFRARGLRGGRRCAQLVLLVTREGLWCLLEYSISK